MPIKVLERFSVEYLQILDEKGKVDRKLMPKLSKEEIKKLYEYMVITRVFDDKAFKLQRQGRIGTYAQSLGQEASVVGSAFALRDEDWIFPSFREHGAFIVKRMPIHQYLQFWSGDERGSRIPEGINIFPVAIPVSTHLPHAVGFAWAMKMRNRKSVTAVYFGDGATSKADFHEALNFAGRFMVPCIFICQNNQFAISVPFASQTAAKTVAQKAIAYGFNGIRVDGNDVFAVYAATKEAVENARSGKGPALIECLTYRIGDHTTSDDASRYRAKEEVEQWKKKDPIARLENYMLKNKMLTSAEKQKILEEAVGRIDQAVKDFEKIPPPKPADMFAHIYADMPPELQRQAEEFHEQEKERSGNISSNNKSPPTNPDEHDVGVAQ